ncbi:MAG TPA: discoidin domain-containing protein [Niabella sp.]|nr:discoidin domain-containing protein [Niabella sp.]HOZ98232.1 discoidin domain-containing protein [Niabella sp.]HQW13208.1 discoidin domain-containing protein [Niabella sp.]HQX18752.1 discoidin domain-containing protein [Niabella sp.]HQX41141.1 discoidin domain-containing protein [Niabella sp.]
MSPALVTSINHFATLRSRVVLLLGFLGCCLSLIAQPKTYCNPINIDYGYTPIPNFSNWGRHRTTADPVIVNYKGDYYLFSTNQQGYWWSSDMLQWHFISHKFLRPWNTGTYDDLCAPAVGIIGDTMIVMGSTYTKNFSIWMSTNPKANDWKPLVDSFEIGGWDPAFFTDDDGKVYMYNGSSNRYPVYGIELNRKDLSPMGTRKEMYLLESWRYGWQRFGEHMDNTFLDPFIEGAWMTKHNNKYYLQYGAPGTEFSGYADGVVVGHNPMGGFVPQSDPLSFKIGGYVRGAGHGSTFQDRFGKYWHVSTTVVSVKNTFERRIGIWPSGFDHDDVMYCNTTFGDYPHYIPDKNIHDVGYGKNGKSPYFTGWMLLNYNKPIQTSSTFGNYLPNYAVDELIKTYWSAKTGDPGEWIQTDLGNLSTVQAVQINYADQDVETNRLGKWTQQYHQYKLSFSEDGKNWKMLMDKSRNKTDIPHEYIQLDKPIQARYLRLENRHMPTGKFAISGFRVFGNGNGQKPETVKDLVVLRTEKDKRSAYIKWKPSNNAFAYNIYYGTDPEKRYNCIMVHSNNEYWMKAMDSQKTYYFSIEAINENGVSNQTPILKVE